MQRKDGYVADVPYPPHFYKEMQPLWLATLAQFLNSPAPDLTKPYAYCELGCGMGINLLVAAATNPHGYFVGVDFNVQHLTIARTAAECIGLTNIHFVQADFSSFLQDNKFYFDFIACHGTWSWIAQQHQQAIQQIVNKSLKPAGIFYLHYMSHPGATHLIPLQKLLNDFAHQASGTSVQKIQHAMMLLQKLVDAGAFIDQPAMVQHVQALAKKDAHYLAHEFLTDYWQPQHSSDLHQQLAITGLEYIGSANAIENMEELSVPGNIQPLLTGLPPSLQETLRDIGRNQHQRMDLFQRKTATTNENNSMLFDAISFQLLPTAPLAGNLLFKTPIGEIPGPAEIFSPLLQALVLQPKTIAQLKQLPVFFHQPELLLQALQMLMWAEYTHPVRTNLNAANDEHIKKLRDWIRKNGLTIEIIERCATAVKTKP